MTNGPGECLAFLFDLRFDKSHNLIKGVSMLSQKICHSIPLFVLVLAVSACNLPSNTPTAKQPVDVEPTQPAPLPDSATATVFIPTATLATSTPVKTATLTVSPTASVVTITADGGNLNVRRGPGIGYNPISGLLKGESSTVIARDETGEWLKLSSIPKLPRKTGWVNAKTKYSGVKGDVMSLPVEKVDPPKPAYVLNCTFHPMDVYPVGVSVPPQNEKPKNKVEISPGEYEVFDSTISGGTSIASIAVLEGETARIKTDGLGNSYSCP
jgi:hypothetical protein